MAPVKPKTSKGKKPLRPPSSFKSKKSAHSSKSARSAKPALPSKPSQVKTKRTTGPVKKKKKIYTDKELGIPALNMITPVGVEKPKGKKKGKVFVDDQQSMMTILAMVNAEKEGQIESKMIRARQLEEIRELRRQEAEARLEQKRFKLEDTKDSLRKRRRSKHIKSAPDSEASENTQKPPKKNQKRVSFG